MSQPELDDEREPEPPRGTLSPTGPAVLVTLGVLGLVLGWAIRPLALRTGYAEPDVSATSIVLLFFVAAIIGGSAYLTRRTVRARRPDLAHHQAVNRLVLGKACALVGALLVGGYFGYALAQLGLGDPASVTRLWRATLAGLGATAVMVCALLLEDACRVRGPDE